jgi:NAD(P)H-flavin reductase
VSKKPPGCLRGGGEIVAHERRTNDIAVITVRTDQPFPYRPGQYVSVETRWFPGVWRPYSMANAPRADGLIQFHVKAISVGWVSSALVRKAQPGHVIWLRRTGRHMVIDPRRRGTSVSPVAPVSHRSRRSWRTWPAGTARDRSTSLRRTSAARAVRPGGHAPPQLTVPQLTVITAVSEDTSFRGERGLLPDDRPLRSGWHTHDVFASGSPPMVTATLNRLLTLGVPQTHIRYDAFGEG